MSFNSIEDMYKVYGFTVGSKIDLILRRLENNETKEEIYEDLVTDKKLMKSKSFQNFWNRVNQIKDDVTYVSI
jgi:hypothetical protein|tara:strand:- start:209 stop:427 length:219 start_codon:yes stop_codon:yes gene_type:complete